MLLDPTTIARFWTHVSKSTEPDGCWLWTGRPNGRFGYGRFWIKQSRYLTHRVSWTINNGPIPDGMLVLHSCDNPPCVNPAHLFLGTHLTNRRDCIEKGRVRYAIGDRNGAHTHPDRVPYGDRNGSRKHPERLARGDRSGPRLHPECMPRGERNPMAKLTADAVLTIRARYAAGGTSYHRLAKEYAVGWTTIQAIISRRNWRHLP
jgi:hypothetical protein